MTGKKKSASEVVQLLYNEKNEMRVQCNGAEDEAKNEGH